MSHYEAVMQNHLQLGYKAGWKACEIALDEGLPMPQIRGEHWKAYGRIPYYRFAPPTAWCEGFDLAIQEFNEKEAYK